MADHHDDSATQEQGSTPVGVAGAEGTKPRKFLERARRDLSEDELGTPAARRFLIAEIERLDDQCAEAKKVEKEYNTLRVEHARLSERNSRSRWNEMMSFACSTIGAAGVGAAPSYLSLANGRDTGIVILAASSLLILISAFSKVFK